jgi:hypothetical protein
MNKVTIFFGFLGIITVLLMENCAHSTPAGESSFSHAIGGLCVQDLTGKGFARSDLLQLVAVFDEKWAKAFPAFADFQAVADWYVDNPFVVFIVDGPVSCPDVVAAAQWPGDLGSCRGVWPGVGKRYAVIERESRLRCTSLIHEMAHVMGYLSLGDSDAQHKNAAVWGPAGVVKTAQKELGGCE